MLDKLLGSSEQTLAGEGVMGRGRKSFPQAGGGFLGPGSTEPQERTEPLFQGDSSFLISTEERVRRGLQHCFLSSPESSPPCHLAGVTYQACWSRTYSQTHRENPQRV